MVELKADSDYLQKRKEMDEKFRRLEERYLELARPILERLRSEGFESDSIEHLVKKYVPLSSQVVSIILEHLEPGQDDRYCESLVRALGLPENLLMEDDWQAFTIRLVMNRFAGLSQIRLR